jgi:hypothetical protein
VGDYHVEKPTRFHSTSFRPIANLLTQRRPVSFGGSAFKKLSCDSFGKGVFRKVAAVSITEVDPEVMSLLPDIIQGVVDRNPDLLRDYGVNTPQELVTAAHQDPLAVAKILGSHAKASGQPQYQELARRMYESGSARENLRTASTVGQTLGTPAGVATDFLPPGKMRNIAQLTSLAGYLPLAGGLVNPYNQGSDPDTQNLVKQIKTEQSLTKAKAVANSSTVDPNVQQEAAQQVQQLSDELQNLRTTYKNPQSQAATDVAGQGTLAGMNAMNAADAVTTAAASPAFARILPAVGGIARQVGTELGGHDNPAYTRDTVTNVLNTGSNVARANAMANVGARAAALAKAAPQAARIARFAPRVARAGASNPLALALQAAASMTEGVMSYNSPEEQQAIRDVRIRQLADQRRGRTTGFDDIAGNLIGGGINGLISPFSDDRRAFRASLVNTLWGTNPADEKAINETLKQDDFNSARDKFQTYLAEKAPWLSNDELSTIAMEAAARQTEHQYGGSGPMSASANGVDAYDLQQELPGMGVPEGIARNVTDLFQLAPQATLGLLTNALQEGSGSDFLDRVPTEPSYLKPSFSDIEGRPIEHQDYTPERAAQFADRRKAEAQKAEVAQSTQQAQTAKDIQALAKSEGRRVQDLENADIGRQIGKEVEHRGAIDALRKTQMANAQWRQDANKRWGNESMPVATPAPEVAIKPLPPAAKAVPAYTAKPHTTPAAPVAATPPVKPEVKVGSLGAVVSRWR